MKKIIRRGTFETNSSSTHSLTMCMKSDYEKWCEGELFLTVGTWGFEPRIKKQFVTKEEAIDLLKNNYKFLPEDMDWNDEYAITELLFDAGFRTGDSYESEYLEWFEEEFTTPNGETVVAFGQFGYDG